MAIKSRVFSLVIFISITTLILFLLPVLHNEVVFAQGFSGNDPASYQCFDPQNKLTDVVPVLTDGVMLCDFGNGEVTRAVLRPPSLQQVEIWFVRIVYIIWAFVATFSFVILLGVAYQYIISRNAGEALAKARDRIAKYALGFALVFLAIPILNTTFRLLGVDDSVECYQGLTGGDNNVGIGFQFFFYDLCTDPRGNFDRSPLEIINEVILAGQNQGLTQDQIRANVVSKINEVNGTACDARRFNQVKSDQIRVLNIPILCLQNACVSGVWNITLAPGLCNP